MPRFGERSTRNLATIHSALQATLNLVIPHYDFAVISGHRTEEEQDTAYARGFSRLPWPQSKHNVWPSLAVDIAPYPIDWEDRESFYLLAGRVLQVADSLGIRVRWGGDWDMDDDLHDQTFFDLGHYELEDERNTPRILYAEDDTDGYESWTPVA